MMIQEPVQRIERVRQDVAVAHGQVLGGAAVAQSAVGVRQVEVSDIVDPEALQQFVRLSADAAWYRPLGRAIVVAATGRVISFDTHKRGSGARDSRLQAGITGCQRG